MQIKLRRLTEGVIGVNRLNNARPYIEDIQEVAVDDLNNLFYRSLIDRGGKKAWIDWKNEKIVFRFILGPMAKNASKALKTELRNAISKLETIPEFSEKIINKLTNSESYIDFLIDLQRAEIEPELDNF